ncbi:MAG: hypothetical protein KJ607_13735 [Bacteroidetes bacterium]|nr:hypothetical protein [Bacteroidota bacterium]
MKTITGYFKAYFREGINRPLYIYTAVFIAACITINYVFDFERTVLDPFFGYASGFLVFFLFYAFAYYMIAIPGAFMLKRTQMLKDHRFWLKSIIFIGLIGMMAGFYHYFKLLPYFQDASDRVMVRKILSNLKRFIPYIVVLFLTQKIFDKDIKGIYGLRFRGTALKPYFVLLLLVSPLILWASFQPDFLKTYPKFNYWQVGDAFGLNTWINGAVFETCYGLDFVSTELIFRGALIIGMVSVMGKDALLPMVATYAFLHFGKPMAETISSVFGGYILGIIAMYSRHIMGGVIIHIGLAWLMELTAILQHLHGNYH